MKFIKKHKETIYVAIGLVMILACYAQAMATDYATL
jgi:hypothetical protein